MKTKRLEELEKVKIIIKTNYNIADCGIFNTRNIVGDPMVTVFEGEYFTVDICFGWAYFEIFGANQKEWDLLEKFYEELGETND